MGLNFAAEKLAHTRQSRPDSGLDLSHFQADSGLDLSQIEVFKSSEGVGLRPLLSDHGAEEDREVRGIELGRTPPHHLNAPVTVRWGGGASDRHKPGTRIGKVSCKDCPAGWSACTSHGHWGGSEVEGEVHGIVLLRTPPHHLGSGFRNQGFVFRMAYGALRVSGFVIMG